MTHVKFSKRYCGYFPGADPRIEDSLAKRLAEEGICKILEAPPEEKKAEPKETKQEPKNPAPKKKEKLSAKEALTKG